MGIRQGFAFVLIACCMMGGCGSIMADQTQDSSENGVVAEQSPAEIAQGWAEQHVASVRGRDRSRWTEGAKTISPGLPLYRPDVSGPAYYEFPVNEGGFVVVSTGVHDFPVAHWNDDGLAPSHVLGAQIAGTGTTIDRVYRLDSLLYVGIDASGNLVAGSGAAILFDRSGRDRDSDARRVYHDFADLEAKYARVFSAELSDLRYRSERSWKLRRSVVRRAGPFLSPASDAWRQGDPLLAVTRAFWIDDADLLRDSIRFRQEPADGCPSGCGPVAWAQYAMYMAYRANRFDLPDAAMGANAFVDNPSSTAFDDSKRRLVMEIRRAVGTFCLGADAGATTFWDMDRFGDWARSKGGSVQVESKWISGQGELARQWLRAGRPVVLGTGLYEHYVVGLAYGELASGDNDVDSYVYVNQGWGGNGNGWIPMSVRFAAVIK